MSIYIQMNDNWLAISLRVTHRTLTNEWIAGLQEHFCRCAIPLNYTSRAIIDLTKIGPSFSRPTETLTFFLPVYTAATRRSRALESISQRVMDPTKLHTQCVSSAWERSKKTKLYEKHVQVEKGMAATKKSSTKAWTKPSRFLQSDYSGRLIVSDRQLV